MVIGAPYYDLMTVNSHPELHVSILSPQILILLESSPNTCSFLGQGCNLQKNIGRESYSMNYASDTYRLTRSLWGLQEQNAGCHASARHLMDAIGLIE